MGIFNILEMQNEQPEEKAEDRNIEVNQIDDNTVQLKDKENKVVELSGSLSSVYTDALSQSYANESVGGIISIMKKRDEDNAEATGHENTDLSNSDLYINIVDKDEVENGDIGQIANNLRVALDKRKSDKQMVVLEGVVDDHRTRLLSDYLKGRGVVCVTSRNVAIEAIRDFLKV
jgi:hypothetical protein